MALAGRVQSCFPFAVSHGSTDPDQLASARISLRVGLRAPASARANTVVAATALNGVIRRQA